MSRIGKLPIKVPAGVEVTISDKNLVTIKGKLGTLQQQVHPDITVKYENGMITVQRPTDQKRHKALHGLYRALLANMVHGVSQGFQIKQELVGVGYKATASPKGKALELSLGFSHNVVMLMPDEVKVETVTERGKNPVITLTSHDKQLIGQIAAKIRSLRKPEPYKGKGIRYVGEYIKIKPGKTSAK